MQDRADGFDCQTDTCAFVGRQVVHDDSVATAQGQYENLLDVRVEGSLIHRPVEYHRRGHAINAQSASERRGLPIPVRLRLSGTGRLRRPLPVWTENHWRVACPYMQTACTACMVNQIPSAPRNPSPIHIGQFPP